jgi:hypothetical protein
LGLIDLQTDLKSLKFGKDRPGGGSSGQPYIKSNIPDKEQPSFLDTDFVWRGGLKAPIRAAEDVARLSKYIFDPKSPRGVLFVAKQNLLSRTAVSTEASTGPAYANGGLNGGVYTPLSTLAQAGVGFTGTHLNKQGIDPTGLIPGLSINKYEKVVWGNNSKEKNRFYKNNEDENLNLASSLLTSLPNVSKTGTGQAAGFASSTSLKSNPNIGLFQNRLLKLLNNKSKNYPEGIIDEYDGGPGSVLGIGKTRIKFATDGGGNLLKSPSYFQTSYISGSGIIFGIDTKKLQEKGKTKENPLISTTPVFNNLLNPIKDYQTKKPRVTQESDSTYKDAKKSIGSILIENQRELLAPNIFDKTTGQWKTYSTLTDSNIYLGEYSSAKTLKNDKLENWKEYAGGTKPKLHKEGYLANLDKNAGSYITNNQKFVFTNNNYQGGIAPDFRLTDRETRGFSDSITIVDDLNDQAKKWITDGKLSKKRDQKENIYKAIDTIYYRSSPSSFKLSQKLNQEDGLIPFNIQIIDSKSKENTHKILRFRAYIDGLSDSYSAGWNSQKYMGRAESLYKYESFDRDISFSFTIVADNPQNLKIMHDMLNALAASLTPQYSDFGYMSGNLHKVTIGKYIDNQYGIVKGFTFDIPDTSPWDIDKQVPLYIKVSGFKFTPIHNFRPEYINGENKRFISNFK